MITFDSKGNLTNEVPLELNILAFTHYFVFNSHRQQLFEQYLKAVTALQTVVSEPFEQWINGSFTTLTDNPNDIDIVTFIPLAVYQKAEAQLVEIKKTFRPMIDAYYVCDYPKNHRNFVHSELDRIEWLHLFSRVRGQKRSKGFIKIYL
jgi:hypothetical protein